ncbi:MAG: protoglobin domain-containing protein, partial [Phycisphaerales bacterium]|nr:protoglobin domain-containing protein [Phycisphaerales bacterium]
MRSGMRKKNRPVTGSAADPRPGSSVRTLRGDVGTPTQTLGIFRDKWLYNGGMSDALFEAMKSYVGFTEQDAAAVAGLMDKVRPHIPEIVQRFYDVILQHPDARLAFSGGDPQIERQKELLAGWLDEVFNGVYEGRYFEARFRIGATHVRVGLPQRFMVLGMEIIWRELTSVLRKSAVTDLDRKLDALHKLLTLDLTIMLQSYQESHVERIRTAERDALEAKLTRAEHLAEIGQLAASLAHEIKNPLAGISGAIQVIGDSLGENNPHRGIVNEILGQIARLDATVKDLLLYARPSRPKAREIKLDSLVSRVLMLIREEPTVRRVRVDYEGANGEAVLHADEGQMEQLLL